MIKNTHLHQNDNNLYHDPVGYRQIVGRLLYLTNTRPDLSFSIQQFSQFMAAPTMNHYKAMTRVLRYIKSIPGQGLFYLATSTVHLKGFTDSDWAAYLDTRRSISRYCMFLGNALISWKSKKQNIVSRSSSEAEYRALAVTSCEVQWLTYLLTDFHISFKHPTLLYCDNNSARYIAANPVFHVRTKHIKIDCHVARKRLQNYASNLKQPDASKLLGPDAPDLPGQMHQNCLDKMHQTWPDAPDLPGQDAPDLPRCTRLA
ncbi:PREDICTED: uncharacterized protein LOC109325593 [Lupinus angustifolius]|uniref:uncharacterized protein LOC109325593 n=1 Tax=Lupinus angustifolius TaxID=3871 RepID=UPI00092F8065|nr:PREDICTED: uncharacterized protein LOC109325593 [Lupinus angustifolius]